MRRQRRAFHSASDEALVNLTPLIDVLFVVLIMFIVIAPLLDVEEVELAPGTPKTSLDLQQLQSDRPISITVKKDNSIWLNKQLVNEEVLEALLREAHGVYLDARPLLFHDREAHFGTYQAVKGAIERAGFDEMDVVLRPG